LVDRAVRAVQQVAAVHKRRRTAAVEVDGVRRAEREQQPGELGEVEAGVDAGAASIAADREQLVLVDPERAARVPLGRDVGVELRCSRREALRDPRGASVTAPSGANRTQLRAGLKGAAIGSCATRRPPIRTSPSGRHGSRRKKPATIASGRPFAAHQWSRRWASSKHVTRTRVARRGCTTT
jgi:hypothetical protein